MSAVVVVEYYKRFWTFKFYVNAFGFFQIKAFFYGSPKKSLISEWWKIIEKVCNQMDILFIQVVRTLVATNLQLFFQKLKRVTGCPCKKLRLQYLKEDLMPLSALAIHLPTCQTFKEILVIRDWRLRTSKICWNQAECSLLITGIMMPFLILAKPPQRIYTTMWVCIFECACRDKNRKKIMAISVQEGKGRPQSQVWV